MSRFLRQVSPVLVALVAVTLVVPTDAMPPGKQPSGQQPQGTSNPAPVGLNNVVTKIPAGPGLLKPPIGLVNPAINPQANAKLPAPLPKVVGNPNQMVQKVLTKKASQFSYCYPHQGGCFWSHSCWCPSYGCTIYWCPVTLRWFCFYDVLGCYCPLDECFGVAVETGPVIILVK